MNRCRCGGRTSSNPPRSAPCPRAPALLLATGIKPALIHLTPWYAGPRAAEITAAQQAAQEQIRDQAIKADPWHRNQPPNPPF